MRVSNFIYRARPGRILFGAGSVQHLAREVLALGANRALVLCSPAHRGLAEVIAFKPGNRTIGIFSGAAMHAPIELVTEAQAVARSLRADCVIAIGSEAAIALANAIALKSDVPFIAVPTTCACNEMTLTYGITESGIRNTGVNGKVPPRTVIYDPELVLSWPAMMSATGRINALAYEADGRYAAGANPTTPSCLFDRGLT